MMLTVKAFNANFRFSGQYNRVKFLFPFVLLRKRIIVGYARVTQLVE